MRRSVILLVILFAISFPVFAQRSRLVLVADGVSPGAVSSPPVEIELDGRLGVVLTTEDRNMRFVEPTSEFETAIPIGFQARVAAYRRDPPMFVLVGERLAVSRIDLERGRSVAVRSTFDPRFGWAIANQPEFPIARFDGSGNLYLLSGTARIIHMSAGGTILWARDLPSLPTACIEVGGLLYVALENGTIMRFDEHGTGRSIIRLETTPRSLAIDPGTGAGALLVAEDGGRLSRYALDDEQPRRLWVRVLPGTANIDGVIGDLAFLRVDNRLYAIDRYGRDRWSTEVSGVVAMLDQQRGVMVDEDGNLGLFAPGEEIRMVELMLEPLGINLLPRQGAILVRYADWSWQIWKIEPPPDENMWLRIVHPPSTRAEPTALAGLVDLALDSSSVATRERVLGIVEERLGNAELYGDVTTARRLAIGLLQEVSDVSTGLDRPDLRRRAAGVLARYLDDRSRGALLRALREDPDTGVAAEAIRALAGWGIEDDDTLAAVERRFSREGNRGRQTLSESAVEFLESLAGSGDPRYRDLAILVSGSDIDTTLRRRAMEAARTSP